MNAQLLKNSGINYEAAIERCAGNRDLYGLILTRFASEGDNCQQIIDAFRNGDYSAVHDLVHNIKGVSGNLELNRLFKVCCNILEELKYERYGNIAPLLIDYEKEYRDVIILINTALK